MIIDVNFVVNKQASMKMAVAIDGLDEYDLVATDIALDTTNDKTGPLSLLACHFCGMQFDVKKTRSLRAHIEEAHVLGGVGYMCGVCCEEFTSRKAVETHMNTFHRAPKPMGCGTCGETFRLRNLLLRHIDSHTPEEITSNKVGLCYCGECFDFFESVTALQNHTISHREQAMFVCGACGLQTQHRHILVKHLECHVISNLLAAEGDTESQMKSQLAVEIDMSCVREIVNDEPSSKEIDSTCEQAMQNENESHAVKQETSYKCGVCGADYSNLEDALSHADGHQEEDTIMTEGLEQNDGMELNELLQEGPMSESTVSASSPSTSSDQ